MVSEFESVQNHPIDTPLPINSRRLSIQVRGYSASTDDKPSLISIGIHRSPEKFVSEAIKVGHVHSLFPDEITDVVSLNLKKGKNMALTRTEEIKRWISMSRDLSELEADFKKTMSARRRTILKDKKLIMFQNLLAEAGHEDVDLVTQLARGFDLTGMLPESHVFNRKARPATISCGELRRAADLGRAGILQSVKSSGDPDLDRDLYAATLKEVSKGFLKEVPDLMTLPQGATLTRRFGVKQKNKVRPIDDYKASFVNSSVSQTESATVHTVDHIASLISCFMRASCNREEMPTLNAKTWDLADAYKQVPLSDEAFEMDSYLVVFCPDTSGPKVFQQSVLPFGSVASVTSFLRIAHALWRLGTKLLGLMWSSYFDDFFSVEIRDFSRHTDLVIASLFSILGWKLSAEKLVDYHTICKVLGGEFDLGMSGEGLSWVYNTGDRVDELCHQLDGIIQSGFLRRSEGERLRGRLQFACGQLFGRSARNHIRILSDHIKSCRSKLDDDTLHALRQIDELIRANRPRKLLGTLTDHFHVYVDASFDDDGYTGIGGALYNSSGQAIKFFSEKVDLSFIETVKQENQKNIIQELEMACFADRH